MIDVMEEPAEETVSEITHVLWYALESGNATPERVKAHIEAGADVNYADIFGDTVLMRAVRGQNTEVIRSLIEAGADVNARYKRNIEALAAKYPFSDMRDLCKAEGWTALMEAVDSDCTPEVAKALLDAGADANAKYTVFTDSYWYEVSVLMIAADSNYHPEVAELLISYGADVNFQDEYGYTPLSQAVKSNDADIMKILLKAGADVGVRCHYEYNYGEYFTYDATYDATLLMLATRYASSEIIKILAEAGADIEAKDDFGDNALMWAVRHEIDEETYPDPDNVKALLASGADVNARGNCGDTALIYSASEGDTEMMQVLIDAGADLYADNRWGRTALTEAASPEAIEILLNSNFNINHRNSNGMTPLMQACYYGNGEAAKTLIKAGADFCCGGFSVDDKNRTALMFACSPYSGHPDIETVQALINAKFYVNAKDDEGRTVLMYAVSCGSDPEVVKALIRAGANVNAKDSRLGKTILMEAAMRARYPEAIKILIRAGADIDAKDKIGSTAKDYADLNPDSEIAGILDGLDANTGGNHHA